MSLHNLSQETTMPLPPFISGLDLARQLYVSAVAPLLSRHFPHLSHSAALIGTGSEVLGYDTAQSRDHDWGPRLLLFFGEDELLRFGPAIDELLRHELPETIAGYPTNLAVIRADGGPGPTGRPGRDHSVRLLSISGFFTSYAGFDPRQPMTIADWLVTPSEILLSLTAGSLFHDGLGELEPIRRRLAWYPHDVWLYLLAAQWRRIAQEEAFPGRCAQVGDELGSRLVAGRLVDDLVRLCFLMERRYAPYVKWLGTAFGKLACAAEMGPLLDAVLRAPDWPSRHEALCRAMAGAARLHNALGLTELLPERVSPFYTRPFEVIHADLFSDALWDTLGDKDVRALPRHLGGVDQYLDSTDALNSPRSFAMLYR